MCFQIDGKYDQTAKCVKFRIMGKVIDCVLSIDTFEHQYTVLKGMLQPPCLKDNMKNIGIDQSLSNRVIFLTQTSSKHQEIISTCWEL